MGQDKEYHMNTLFCSKGHKASGAYGALSNKFTDIRGSYANMVEVYGGWYINHKFLLGIGAAAVTNNIPVPEQFNSVPGINMSYEYGQFGLMTEYIIGNHKAVHLAFQLFSGAGFTVQYQRYNWKDDDFWEDHNNQPHDQNCFFVAEPGVKVEMNLFRWLRFSPGVSYRRSFGSDANGLSDRDISGTSVNLTLKFGKF